MWRLLLRLITFLLLVSSSHPAAAETVVLPISLDFPLLRSFALSQLFTGPGRSAEIINAYDGCQYLELRDPQFRSENNFLLINAKISIKGGIPASGTCGMPIVWEGYVDILQKITVRMPNWELRVETVDSRYRNLDGKQTVLNEFLWNLIKDRMHRHLDQMSISLRPSVHEIASLLHLFTAYEPGRIDSWLRSLRPGAIRVTPNGIRAEVLMDIKGTAVAPAGNLVEKPLTQEELERFLRSWEEFDAFLANQIRSMAAFSLSDEERSEVLQTLLQTRYQLAGELTAAQPQPRADMVRRQFVMTWSRLAPLFRKHLILEGTVSPLSILAYLSAGDALMVLDRLGPSFGMEVSRDGLIRLARLLAGERAPVELSYSYEIDPELRRIMGFGPEPVSDWTGVAGEVISLEGLGRSLELKTDWQNPINWLDLLISPAYAAESAPPDLQAIKKWLVNTENVDDYLQLVRSTLKTACEQAIVPGSALASRRELFIRLMDATAWLESCFQHFTRNRDKLTYVRSSNNTSVGLMQINERIWRGLYRIEALRWDPAYNIRAGIEIMQTYLNRYVLNQQSHAAQLDDDTLVRVAYAMYNGGPGQLKAFLARQRSQSYYLSDRLFWEKYSWSKAGDFGKLRQCFGD
ncbi:MAG: lytic transglycosylase domain-containing protein [Desulfobulbaceae bacterium]|nr:lytic transglycosylase domain-containing protein [Desulfobulbaceae bacterium]